MRFQFFALFCTAAVANIANAEIVEVVFSGDATNSRGVFSHVPGETFDVRVVFDTDAALPNVEFGVDPSSVRFDDGSSSGTATGLVSVEVTTPAGEMSFTPSELSDFYSAVVVQSFGFFCCENFDFLIFENTFPLIPIPSTFIGRDVQTVIVSILANGDPLTTMFTDPQSLLSNIDNFVRGNILEASVRITFLDASDPFAPQAEYAQYFVSESDELDIRVVSAQGDIDNDGVPDKSDNCVTIPNSLQIDADGDGSGNLCDADFNNDDIVNISDLGIMRSVFFTSDPVVDLDSSGTVNVVDLGILRGLFFQQPGR